jgi:hypothetical protein
MPSKAVRQIIFGSYVCPEARAFLARTSALDDRHRRAYIKYINTLAASSIFGAMRALYVLGTQDATNALLDLTANASDLTTGGSPTFTTDRGYNLTTTNVLNLPFTGAALSQNSVSVGGWVSSSATNNGVSVGGTNLVGSLLSNGNIQGRLFDTGSDVVAAAGASGGLYANNRSASNAKQMFFNGLSVGTFTTASSAQTPSLAVSGASGSAVRVAMAFFASRSLSADEHLLLHQRTATLMAELGAT